MKLLNLIIIALLASTANAKEIKLGIMHHDFDSKLGHRVEKGKNINVEYLFDKMQNFLRAHPHVGASINTKGYTSNIYTGMTWQFDLGETFLIEASLGLSVNNAEKKKTKKKRALGSNLLFRESLAAGFRFSEIHSITLVIDHTSSADIAMPNPGLTDIGIRYGYRF